MAEGYSTPGSSSPRQEAESFRKMAKSFSPVSSSPQEESLKNFFYPKLTSNLTGPSSPQELKSFGRTLHVIEGYSTPWSSSPQQEAESSGKMAKSPPSVSSSQQEVESFGKITNTAEGYFADSSSPQKVIKLGKEKKIEKKSYKRMPPPMRTCTALPDFPSSSRFEPWQVAVAKVLGRPKPLDTSCESQTEKDILFSPPSPRPHKRKRNLSFKSDVSPHHKLLKSSRVSPTPIESSSDTSSESSVLSFKSPPTPLPHKRYKRPEKPEVPPAVTIKNNFFKLLLRIVHSKEKLTPRKLANQLNSYDSYFSTWTKDCRDTDDVIEVLVDKTTPLDAGLLKFLDDNDRFQADIEEYESDLKKYLKVNIQDLFTGYSCFLAGKESSMQSHHARTIKKLKGLRRQIDSTPSPQEIALTIDFLTEGTSDGEKASDLKGVSMLEEKTIEVTQSGLLFEWEGYGIKLYIPSNALPYHMEKCTITIKVSLSGQYQFPVGTELVSPVFWLSCQPSRKFQQPLSLEIQHCALPENSHSLLMVKASCTQIELPYSFKPLYGGTFNQHSSYGVIAMNSFSGVGVIQEKSEERRYWSSVFYMGPPNSRDIHFTVTSRVQIAVHNHTISPYPAVLV